VNVLGVGFLFTSATNFLYNINSSGTWNTSTLNVSTINASSITGYQQSLIAGTGITLNGNTISVTDPLPTDANFSSVNASTVNASVINGANLSTATMRFSSDFSLDTFSNTLNFEGETGADAVRDLEDNGLTTVSIDTDSLTVSGFSNVNVLGVGFFLTSATNFLYNINSSGTWNTSTLNVSTINASNIVGYQETLIAGTNITITGNTISSAGGGGTLPADANFSSVNTSTLNTSTIDTSGRVDIGNSDGQSKGLVLTGDSPTITLKDTDHRSGMIHMNDNRMYFLSGVTNSEAWTRVQGEWPLILHTDTNRAQFGGQLDCDMDAFHYSAGNEQISRSNGADVSWTSTRRGSTIQNGDSFRPKYSGKYSITLAINLTGGSTGSVRISLKLNNIYYNLNGGANTYIISANNTNVAGNMILGNMIVDAVAGQDIKAFVNEGTLRYYGSYSYFAGYYIGDI
jgi:hypothetical protein